MAELVFARRTRMQHRMFSVERFYTGNAPPASADTVYNLGYWNNTSGDLAGGVVDATQSGDTLRIRSSGRGLSVYARR
jgi:hypothetical protein